MPDIYLDVDAALTEVPVNIFPLTDDTDFKTRETAVAYNAAGMDLVWNFVTSAGAFTQIAVTPTTAGTYDWTHQGDGMYTIEIPASGGASINNDTEGYGWFTGLATGVLPWRGPIVGFRHSAINDSMCDTNTTGFLAPTTAGRTLDVTAGGCAGVDWANVEAPTTTLGLTNTTVGVLTTYTGNTPQTGDSYARIGATGSGLTSLASQASVDTIDNFIDTEIADIQARLPAALVGGRIDANIGAISGDATAADNAESFFDGTGYAGTGNVIPTVTTLTNLPAITANWLTAAGTAADFTTEVQSGLATAANLATVAGYLDTEIAAILADTNELQTDWANGGRLDLILDARASQTSVDTVDDFLDTEIAALTSELAKVPKSDGTATWNATALASLQAEATDALNAYDPPTNAEFEARTPTAAQLAYIVANAATALPVTFTTSGGSTTAAVLNLVDGNAASATNDQYNGRLLVFTDGTLKGVVTDITDYVGGTTTATITAIPFAPTSSHNARLI